MATSYLKEYLLSQLCKLGIDWPPPKEEEKPVVVQQTLTEAGYTPLLPTDEIPVALLPGMLRLDKQSWLNALSIEATFSSDVEDGDLVYPAAAGVSGEFISNIAELRDAVWKPVNQVSGTASKDEDSPRIWGIAYKHVGRVMFGPVVFHQRFAFKTGDILYVGDSGEITTNNEGAVLGVCLAPGSIFIDLSVTSSKLALDALQERVDKLEQGQEEAGGSISDLTEEIKDIQKELDKKLENGDNISNSTVTASGSTTARPLKDRFADVVNVKDFGAVGDGKNDDTEAIQKAFTAGASTKKTVYFPDGIYPATLIDMSSGVTMSESSKILFVGDTEDTFISFTASSVHVGRLEIDYNGKQLLNGFTVSGKGNTFDTIVQYNMQSSTILCRGMYITGNDNVFSNIVSKDMIKLEYGNDSSPQSVCLSDAATGNVFHDISSYNVRSTVVNNSTGTNTFGNVYSYNCKDNGFYAVADGLSNVGTIYYDGDDNAVGFRHGANVIIGTLLITRAVNPAVFFGDCGDISISRIVARNCGVLLFTNDANTGHIRIGEIDAEISDGYPILFRKETGVVRELSIDTIKVYMKYTDDVNVSRASFIRLDACKQININNIDLKILVSDYLDGNLFIYCVLPDEVPYPSMIGNISCKFYDFTGDSLSQKNCVFFINNPAKQNLRILSGNINSRGTLQFDNSSNNDGLWGGTAPVSGYWYRGTIIRKSGINNSIAGYICTESGSPGSWGTLQVFTDSFTLPVLKVTSLQPQKMFYPGSDNAVSVGGSAYRFAQVYAASGSINTSDQNEKQNIEAYPDAVLDAWGEVELRQFLSKDAVKKKGDAARIHAGVIAQQVMEAFEKHNLDATRYGLLCYDKWEDEYEDVEVEDEPPMLDADGNEVTPAKTHTEKRLVTAAGDRYGIRYSEALCLEAAYQRRRASRLEARVAALETALQNLNLPTASGEEFPNE